MKPKLEKFVLGLILAPVAPLALFMLAWWLSFALLPENLIAIGTLAGLILGIALDFFIVKGLVLRAYRLGTAFWLGVLLFYSVGTFGVFMGVPVFNVGLAVPAGIVAGGKLAHEKADPRRVNRTARSTSIVTTVIFFLVCVASAVVALASPSTPSDLRGTLGLSFEVTLPMVWGLILVGGAALLAVNWWLTGLSVRMTHRFLSKP